MPDSRSFSEHRPHDWSDAFANLPMETPPADGWTRVVHALDARASHSSTPRRREYSARRWPIWAASAAVIALAAWVPLNRWIEGSGTTTAPRIGIAPHPSTAIEAASVAVESGPVVHSTRPRPTAPASSKSAGTPHAAAMASTAESAGSAPASSATRKVPRRHAHSRSASQVRMASTAATTASSDALQTSQETSPTNTAVAQAASDPMQQLYAESAQLEALVALARDDRVATASGAVITGELDARIGLIDAALSQPDLPPAQRNVLWQQRIGALRELAGVESTERWLAARGESFEGTVVHVD